jgi:hypothetical protein
MMLALISSFMQMIEVAYCSIELHVAGVASE